VEMLRYILCTEEIMIRIGPVKGHVEMWTKPERLLTFEASFYKHE
jgi:hypothetical protein